MKFTGCEYVNFTETQQKAITEAGNCFNIKRLYLFGSALNDTFSETSDIDFLVEFNRNGFSGSFDQYFGFKEALEKILDREVDLVCRKSLRNPVFIKEVESSKKLVYRAQETY